MASQRKNFVFGSFGNDVLTGTNRRDYIFGSFGNDDISTGAGNDRIFAGFGDDTITGGAGNDRVFGGLGFDTARYDGGIADYDVQVGPGRSGPTTVTSKNDVSDAGSDQLYSVEALYFAADDYTLFLDGTNNAVLAADDAVATGENEVLSIAAADLLANDREFDGDSLTITFVDPISASGAIVTFVDGQISFDPGTVFDGLKEGETATDTFSYIVDDGKGGTDVATVTVTVTGVNDAPVLTVGNVTIDENTTAVLAAISASDLDSDTLTFRLGGVDADLFEIDATTGALRFIAAPDFEAPSDGDGDNRYDISINVQDEQGAVTSESIVVTVADVPEITARINEFHYDNEGTDVGEFIEVRVNAGADVSLLSIALYNGSNGSVYGTQIVRDAVLTSDGTFDYYVINLPTNGLQNGAPDGLALVNGETVVEFLSYEGTFAAIDGPAVGQTSVDIDVNEPGSTPIGQSLQRNDDGSWAAPAANTAGAANVTGPIELNARINEFHYDNAGGDVGEFIEVRVNAGAEVTALTVAAYNGSNGLVYRAEQVSAGEKTTDGTFDYYVINLPVNGLQNGAPDGLALVNGATVIEFLSYEGTMTAADGPAIGQTSTDIGVAEDGSTPIGFSLQRDDDGTWRAPAAATSGLANGDVIVNPPFTDQFISAVQGAGSASALDGQTVRVEAVVTHIVSNGYFLQEEDADADADLATSEGIFVFTSTVPVVTVGNLVRLIAVVQERFDQTQLTNVTSEIVTTTLVATPTAASILLGPDAAPDYEAVEGMLVTVTSGTPDPLTVITNFNFDRFGQLVISAGVQTQATQLFDAQTQAAEIAALQAQNDNNSLILDDGDGSQNPDQFEFVPGGPGDNGNGFLDAGDDFGDAGTTIRLGAEINDSVTGVMTYAFGDYQLVVTKPLDIDQSTNTGARQDSPDDVGGRLQVASVNVLNYFTTIDATGAGTGPNGDLDPRGADNDAELVRQTEKLVAMITGTQAEVFALQEIENNGFGAGSAVSTLVDELNIEAGITGSGASYAFAAPNTGTGFVGTDAITTAIIYDANAVRLIYSEALFYQEASAQTTLDLAAVLGSSLGDFQRNRPSIAATFEDLETGEQFTVVSSHFKSKGASGLDTLANAAQAALDAGTASGFTQADVDAFRADPNFDLGNGQGFWNQVRLDAAVELANWIENDFGGTGVTNYLLLGDMNAYAQEDPVQYLDDDAGLVDLIDQFIGQDEAYSFVFDGQRGTLDQGLADQILAGFVTGVTEWHINADEPDLINYDTSFKDARFYNDGVFAASDHDPLIVGLDFSLIQPVEQIA